MKAIYNIEVYNEMYEIYPENTYVAENPDHMITDDSESGYQFFSKTAETAICNSAGGKSNII